MLTYYDSKNQPYVLTNRIGSGGEGTVYSCPNNEKIVAKIYHAPITDEKAEKLRWMAENSNPQLLKIAAWIVDTLHDKPGGKVVGFTMPSVRAKEIHELYSLKSRRVYFPEATWQFLIHAAANLARAFYNLHKNEHVMGDVNHGNCVVLADATVKLIDCDSYSIKLGNRRYPCEVGVASHLAPELQGVNLRDVERLEKHDNFGLAVIIFQLLFLGRHPFAGNYAGGEDKSLEDSIRELRFAYGKDADLRNVKRPPGTLSLDAVSPQLALLFERAFLTENRPEPREWIEALEDLSQNLKSCAMHPGHHYYRELHLCPWCEIEAQTGLMLFPFVSNTNRLSDGETFNIFTVENLIASFNVSRNLPAALPVKPGIAPPEPSFRAHAVKKEIRSRFIILAITQFLVTGFFVLLLGGCTVFIPSMLILIVCITSFNNFAKSHMIDLEVNLDSAKREREKFEKEWKSNAESAELNDNFDQIRKRINDYKHLPKDSRQKINRLHNARFRREVNDYLSSFRLTDNQIPGIGEKRLGVLRDFGVKTAADIEANRLRSIPGTGDATAQKLLDWRTELERNFSYVPDVEISKTEQEQIEHEFSETRRKIEQEIGKQLVALRSSSVKVQRQQQQLVVKAETIAKQFAQAEKDFASIALKAPAMITMFFIAFFMMIFGNLFYNSAPSTRTADYERTSPSLLVEHGIGAESLKYSGSAAYNVSESITDREIEAMTSEFRRQAAADIYYQSLPLKDNIKVEQKMRLALRLNSNDINVLNQLASVLYEQKKYKESLEILDWALMVAPKNFGTKTFIGMNYIMLERFSDARKVFTELSLDNPNANSVFYNLGLSYKGLKDYPSAVNAFRSAVELSPNDADSLYEAGYCLYKMGDNEGARKQYENLLEVDTLVAQKLKKEAKIR